jgi:ribonuclease P protein component
VGKQFTLGKNEKLKSRKRIEELFDKGKSFVVNPFRVYFVLYDDPDSYRESKMNEKRFLQFGVGVSSKNFKRAVDRNRIKRLTREAWRLQKNELNEVTRSSGKQLNVFFIYSAKELPDFATVKDKVAVALKKLLSKVNENNSANP